MNARRYRRRPPEVEAMLLSADNADVVALWAGGTVVDDELRLPSVQIQPEVGEYVVRAVMPNGLGPAHSVKADVFTWAWCRSISR